MRKHVLIATLLTAGSALLQASPSYAADPTTADCLSASDGSLRLGNAHQFRAERAQLLVCAATTCPADIRKECIARVDEVNAAIPTLIFQVKDGAGHDLSAVKVTIDGEMLAERIDGTALSVDPGEHTFAFESTSFPAVRKTLMIREGEKSRREVIVLGTDSALTTPVPSPKIAPPPGSVSGDASEASPSAGLGTQKTVALVAGGVGALGVVVGSVFTFIAVSKKSDARDACPNECSNERDVNRWHDAKSAGNVATAAFIVGGVGLAAGAVLWFSAKKTDSTQVGVGLGALQLKGTF